MLPFFFPSVFRLYASQLPFYITIPSASELRLQEDGNATTDKESTSPIYLPRAFVRNILLECTADLVGKQLGLKR